LAKPTAPSGDERLTMRTDPDPALQARGKSRFEVRRLLPLAVVVAAMILALAMGWHRTLSLETLVRHRAEIDAFIAAHGTAALGAFVAIYIAVVSLSLPGATILTMTGGLLFGAIVGGSAAIVGATIGATIIFLIARTAAGEFLLRRAGPLAAKVTQGFRDNAFSYLLFLRLVPVFPFWLVNLAAALAGIGLGAFVGATALGIIPGTFIYAFVGAGLDGAIGALDADYRACLAAGRSDCRIDFDATKALTPTLIAALAALALLALLPVLVRRRNARRQAAGPAA
jgi:uncharacterized membrane protein YdjX (TVP38/TMEM64 family)